MKFQSAVLISILSSQIQTCSSTAFTSKNPTFLHILEMRGGDATDAAHLEGESLEDRVHKAMAKLGLSSPEEIAKRAEGSCEDGVCEIEPTVPSPENTESFQDMKVRLAEEMNVDENIVQAALGATMKVGTEPEAHRLDEQSARKMIQYEIEAINRIMEDSDEVQTLISEGHDPILSRRALAFADMNLTVARAILVADEEDAIEEEEAAAKIMAEREEEKKRAQLRLEAEEKKKKEAEMKTVTVDAGFDPTKTPAGDASLDASRGGLKAPQGAPSPAKKDDVIFQATSENIQKIVLESPVPVVLDVYADWCGPCKALTPALEQMAIKGGGMFRLVKLNTDEERTISSALEVTSLPTIFGIKDGKIVHSFKGMPRDEDFMRNFMMGLLGAADFSPPVTLEEKQKYVELSNKLIKIAGASGFSFSQRERLQVRTHNKLDELVNVRGDMAGAEESAKVVRHLLSNVIREPFEAKFRNVNLQNKVIAARIGAFSPAISILKSVGFKDSKESPGKSLVLGDSKKIVNIAPLVVARDTIDKWIDLNRRAIATALRKKQDELARERLLEDAEEIESDDEGDDDDSAPAIDFDACNLKLRIEGKNKIHNLSLHADDILSDIIESIPVEVPQGDEITITCTARRLVVKNTDKEAMRKTLRESRLTPAASIVIKIGSGVTKVPSTSSLKERAAARKLKSKGEHNMASIGIYSKDDDAKGELIDGGGGVWYEHDVSSDDEEENNSDVQNGDGNEDSEK